MPAYLKCITWEVSAYTASVHHANEWYLQKQPDLDSSLDVFFSPGAPAIEREGNGNGLLMSQASFHGSS